jgi:predicted TIM-barrel fold metal-dependent hydrolase
LIVDANLHATLSGRWFDTDVDAGLGRLIHELDAGDVERAVLTGVPGYVDTAEVLELCRLGDGRLLPVGSFNPCAYGSVREMRQAAGHDLRDRGLLGVKLHPRLGRYDPLDDRVLAFLDEVAGWDERLAIWVCSLFHAPGVALRKGPVESACDLVGRTPELTFVLAHGGGPHLLAMATALRPAPNVYLDLSWTATRLAGSSIRLDIAHLLDTFDRRLVFGSDFPEVSIAEAIGSLRSVAGDAASAVWGSNLVGLLRSSR